jgi:hypothetical protein
MSMLNPDERLIGKLEAHVEDLRADVKAMRSDIGSLKNMVEQAKGARWAVVTLASAFGGLGSLFMAWATGLFKPPL